MPIKAGNVVYKDFGACVAGLRRKGKSPESAKKICGALQSRQEGRAANASQLPQEVQPHFIRSAKAFDFLKEQGVLVDDDNQEISYNDTSLDNQTPISGQLSNIIYSDPESYTDKVTRIMDEYQISEEEAKQIVGKIIQDEMAELDRREYELIKQAKIEEAQANMMTSDDAQEPQPVQQEQEQQEDVSSDNNSDNGNNSE